jgi:hypothetical protein
VAPRLSRFWCGQMLLGHRFGLESIDVLALGMILFELLTQSTSVRGGGSDAFGGGD